MPVFCWSLYQYVIIVHHKFRNLSFQQEISKYKKIPQSYTGFSSASYVAYLNRARAHPGSQSTWHSRVCVTITLKSKLLMGSAPALLPKPFMWGFSPVKIQLNTIQWLCWGFNGSRYTVPLTCCCRFANSKAASESEAASNDSSVAAQSRKPWHSY